MKVQKLFLAIISLLFFVRCNYLDGIPVIGIDAQGNPAQVFVPKGEYPKRLHAAISHIQESAVPVLGQSNGSSCSGWMLRVISFGVAVGVTVGIGPYQVGAMPKFRMMFTNSMEPLLP